MNVSNRILKTDPVLLMQFLVPFHPITFLLNSNLAHSCPWLKKLTRKWSEHSSNCTIFYTWRCIFLLLNPLYKFVNSTSKLSTNSLSFITKFGDIIFLFLKFYFLLITMKYFLPYQISQNTSDHITESFRPYNHTMAVHFCHSRVALQRVFTCSWIASVWLNGAKIPTPVACIIKLLWS